MPSTDAPVRAAAVCGGRLAYAHFGSALGDASPRAPEAPDRIRRALRSLGYESAVMMQPDFTNVVLASDEVEPWAPGVSRSARRCDGVLVEPGDPPVLIANGDCCVGVLSGGGRAVVMHLGLACVHRSDGRPPLMEVAAEALGVSAGEMSFFAGGAIGPCCHGYGHHTAAERRRAAAILEAYGPEAIPGRVTRGPRRGAHAYDHVFMALTQATRLGVGSVEADRRCTSCEGVKDPEEVGYGRFFSHTRDGHEGRERNLAVVGWPAPTISGAR